MHPRLDPDCPLVRLPPSPPFRSSLFQRQCVEFLVQLLQVFAREQVLIHRYFLFLLVVLLLPTSLRPRKPVGLGAAASSVQLLLCRGGEAEVRI